MEFADAWTAKTGAGAILEGADQGIYALERVDAAAPDDRRLTARPMSATASSCSTGCASFAIEALGEEAGPTRSCSG